MTEKKRCNVCDGLERIAGERLSPYQCQCKAHQMENFICFIKQSLKRSKKEIIEYDEIYHSKIKEDAKEILLQECIADFDLIDKMHEEISLFALKMYDKFMHDEKLFLFAKTDVLHQPPEKQQ